jgi:hypothetical protein
MLEITQENFFCQWQPYFAVGVKIGSPYGLHKRRKTRESSTLRKERNTVGDAGQTETSQRDWRAVSIYAHLQGIGYQ